MTAQKVLKQGKGWRLGWDPTAIEFVGLVGTDEWAIELTAAEFQDFCRLLQQLAETMTAMASELMPEERITCEAESEWVWLAVEGYPHAYGLSVIIHSGRRAEGYWPPAAVPGLLAATQTWSVF
ncbi:DUF1818 family protein [Trichothermofontia sichuanensis B231]|uniref:DUF1818 family protein n=1 Tax=Trichothermofontia sichuanensis TaxID=3045816 RepID=UPI002245A630|nr:DUF1818 family protein [Trichothermofontia sichuanensis]UZQ53991.1 DUF1818 family protein [Trichothermofontia sichuanensis B231]